MQLHYRRAEGDRSGNFPLQVGAQFPGMESWRAKIRKYIDEKTTIQKLKKNNKRVVGPTGHRA